MRVVGSALAGPVLRASRRRRRRSGPRHGGPREVVHMLHQNRLDRPRSRADQAGEGRRATLMGFGTASTRTRPAREDHSARSRTEVFDVTGKNPLIDNPPSSSSGSRSRTTTHQAQAFILNVDFYSGIISRHGLPGRDVPVLFAIPRTADGWPSGPSCSPTRNSASPGRSKLYTGHDTRSYVPIEQRDEVGADETEVRGPL